MTRRRARRRAQENKRGHLGPFRLVLEPLEARRLLAGLSAGVYIDQDGSRSFEPSSDSPAANRLVFVDFNRSGSYDDGEPVAVTDRTGVAWFDGLEDGEYELGLLTSDDLQPQVAPTRVAQESELLSAKPSSQLFASADAADLWVVDASGVAERVGGLSPSVNLGGRVVASVSVSDEAVWSVVQAESSQRLVALDLQSGAITPKPLGGLSADNQIYGLAQTASQTVALVGGWNGRSLVSIAGSNSRPLLHLTSVVAVSGSRNSEYVAALEINQAGNAVASLLDPENDFSVVDSFTLDGSASAIDYSQDGDLVLLSMDGGGVVALAVDGDALGLSAILDDAAGPVVAASLDGRIVTGSIRNPAELIVWNRQSWSEVGRSGLPTSESASRIRQFATDRFGDTLLALGDSGLHAVSLSLPTGRAAVVQGATSERVQLGIRSSRYSNSAPDVSGFAARSLLEDTNDSLDLRSADGIIDPEGQPLWFTLAEPPKYGSLRLSPTGNVDYVPALNYNGSDSAKVLVHDGQQATELVIRWEVRAVNDPPLSIGVDISPTPEDLTPGTQVGFVSIVDVDARADYRITSSDPRFRVDNGRVYFAGGKLDFETQASIDVQFVAYDVDDPAISIIANTRVQLTDVNEPPTSVRINTNQIPENVSGYQIGQIVVDDPDADSFYEFYVEDSRFKVEDGVLMLVDDASLDFEYEPEIEVNIRARDPQGLQYEITQSIQLQVVNQNDPPTGISISKATVYRHTPGAPVGEIHVEDPDGDAYSYDVSDERFEVDEAGVLKLRDQAEVDLDAGEEILLTVNANGTNGDRAIATFPIIIEPKHKPYHNPRTPSDVNNDGIVTPSDVLIIINDLNENGSHPVPRSGNASGESPEYMPDVNGDGIITPLDVLLIINELNHVFEYDPEGEAADESQQVDGPADDPMESSDPSAFQSIFIDVDQERRKQACSIDAELESLLDQLSRAERGSM